jgi:hypothetical protein
VDADESVYLICQGPAPSSEPIGGIRGPPRTTRGVIPGKDKDKTRLFDGNSESAERRRRQNERAF